ncbi:unnamed protein product [Candida verbasci]|uniref:ATP synthase subunit g, mitochondrial n=1 Tax=Candida verbasci TaxID=1227364 RepID=A0A9W4TTP8_9ASCO|nr:unnamed protein product [Candida verbasci]
MSAIVSKASNILTSIVNKSTGLLNSTIYWAKVGGELSKAIYKHEKLSPPSFKEFESVYQQALKLIKSPKDQEKLFQQLKQYKPTQQHLVQVGVYGIQLAAFFSVGEIIGRRQIVGYPKPSHH